MKTAERTHRSNKMRVSGGYRAFQGLNFLIMLFVCLVILFPLYYMVIVSLSDGAAVMAGKVRFLPVGFSLRAYRAAMRDAAFLGSYWNTIVITVAGTVINLFMTTLCAYPLSRPDLQGRKTFMRLAVFTMFFTGGMIPSYMLVTGMGLGGTYWAIILPGAISVYNMIIMRTFFENIPIDLTEAAYIDGANDVYILGRIILPLSKPIIWTMVLFYAVGHWNGYFSAMLYLSNKNQYPIQLFVRSVVLSGDTLSMAMVSYNSSTEMGAELLAEDAAKYAIIIMSMLPILIVFPFVSRHFKDGVMIGAIKG